MLGYGAIWSMPGVLLFIHKLAMALLSRVPSREDDDQYSLAGDQNESSIILRCVDSTDLTQRAR